MARQAWQRTITDAAGNVLTGVQITVFQENGVTLATIYGQQTGGAALANPFSTGAQTSAKFYADPGRYVVRAFKDGLTQEFTDVDISGKSVREDLGSAAYLTATTSASDETIGRALRVGDFGLGRGSSSPGVSFAADLNDLTAYGLFYTATGANRPAGAQAGQVLVGATGGANNNLFQLFFEDIGSRSFMAFRIRNNGAWQPWQAITHAGNVLGTVAFSGGVNTGAIIERGSNSNGEYVKFADGTMICSRNYNETVDITTAEGALYRNASGLTWAFPAAFLAGYPVTVSGQFPTVGAWLSQRTTSNTNIIYYWQSATNFSADGVASLCAIGFWR